MEKHYDFKRIEPQMQALWEEEQIYKFDSNKAGELYSIDTPPPTVSGTPHVGHLFSYTQAEIIARFRRMQGYHVFYPFGFDDNGLPSERLVERDEAIRARDYPRSEFIEKCKNTTEKYESEFRAFWKALGFSVDWSLQYETVSPQVQKISQKLFLDLVEQGRAYTKESPVLWCTQCQTSIAQAELDTKDIDSAFHYLSFTVDGAPLRVATTRPELLYGCVCLFVNPNDARYGHLLGRKAVVPLYDYEIPLIADENVAMAKGSGVVMCATFGDATDVEWFHTHSLPYRKVILQDGTIAREVPFLGGLKVKAARKEIVRRLEQAGLLICSEQITHAAPVHERCGTEIEIIPSLQWYIDILSQKERFLKAADEINWYPAHMKSRYTAWVENLKWDWCISRQRYFGVPFPVWYCKACGQAVYAPSEMLPVNPLETQYPNSCTCGCKEFMPESSVLDTWATSSVTPQINERFGLPLTPMSMRTHAHEIIRTWTFYTIVRSLYHTGAIPWKDLMINGFVLAKKGEKLSKSKNNSAMEPKALIAAHSADVLRYWSANARLGTDTFFAPEELAVSKRFVTKLWNASKFATSHLQDACFSEPPQLLPIDQWMLERTREGAQKASAFLRQYEIGMARHEMDALFWKDFCDNYIELVKSRLYEPERFGDAERRSAQYALYHTLLTLLKLYAIYVPHITEYIYQDFFKKHEKSKSIHLLRWEQPQPINQDLLAFGDDLKNAVSDMRKCKSENNLSVKAEMERWEIACQSPAFLTWFQQTQPDLQACANAKKVAFKLQ